MLEHDHVVALFYSCVDTNMLHVNYMCIDYGLDHMLLFVNKLTDQLGTGHKNSKENLHLKDYDLFCSLYIGQVSIKGKERQLEERIHTKSRKIHFNAAIDKVY